MFLLEPFLKSEKYFLDLSPDVMHRADDLFEQCGLELKNQTDWYWSCRTRSFLIELLFILECVYFYKNQTTTPKKYNFRIPSTPPPDNGTNKTDVKIKTDNHGKLILDATAAPSDIRYPTDLSLLNECRENTESMIDEIWEFTDKKGHKTAYNRKKARNNYLKVAKQRKARPQVTRKAIG